MIAHNCHYMEEFLVTEVSMRKSSILSYLADSFKSNAVPSSSLSPTTVDEKSSSSVPSFLPPQQQHQQHQQHQLKSQTQQQPYQVKNIFFSIQSINGKENEVIEINTEDIKKWKRREATKKRIEVKRLARENDEKDGDNEEEEAEEEEEEEVFEFLLPSSRISSSSTKKLKNSSDEDLYNLACQLVINYHRPILSAVDSSSAAVIETQTLRRTVNLSLSQLLSAVSFPTSPTVTSSANLSQSPATLSLQYKSSGKYVNNYFLSFLPSSSIVSSSSPLSMRITDFQLKIISMKNILPVDLLTKTSDVYYLLFFTNENGQKLLRNPSSNVVSSASSNKSAVSTFGKLFTSSTPPPPPSSAASSPISPHQHIHDYYFYHSEIKYQDINPTFNNIHCIDEELLSQYSLSGLPIFLLIEIWDNNMTRKDQALGEVFIPIILGRNIISKIQSTTSEKDSKRLSKPPSPSGAGRKGYLTETQRLLAIQPTKKMKDFFLKNMILSSAHDNNGCTVDSGLGTVLLEFLPPSPNTIASDIAVAKRTSFFSNNSSTGSGNVRKSLGTVSNKVDIPINIAIRSLHPMDRLWPVQFLLNNTGGGGGVSGSGKEKEERTGIYSQLFHCEIQHDSLILSPYFPTSLHSSSSSSGSSLPPSSASKDLLKVLFECEENHKTLRISEKHVKFEEEKEDSPHSSRENEAVTTPVKHSQSEKTAEKKKPFSRSSIFNIFSSKYSSSSSSLSKERRHLSTPRKKNSQQQQQPSLHKKLEKNKLNTFSAKQEKEDFSQKFDQISLEIDYSTILPENIRILSPNTLLVKLTLKRLMSVTTNKNGSTLVPRLISYDIIIGPCIAVDVYSYFLSRIELFSQRKSLNDLLIYSTSHAIPLIKVDTIHDILINKLHLINQEISFYEVDYSHDLHTYHTDGISSTSPRSPHSPASFASVSGKRDSSSFAGSSSAGINSPRSSVPLPGTTLNTVSSLDSLLFLSQNSHYEMNNILSHKHYLFGNYRSLLLIKQTLLYYYQYFLYFTSHVEKYWLNDIDLTSLEFQSSGKSFKKSTFKSFSLNYSDEKIIQQLTAAMEEELRKISLNSSDMTNNSSSSSLYYISNNILLELTFHLRMIYLFFYCEKAKKQREILYNESCKATAGTDTGIEEQQLIIKIQQEYEKNLLKAINSLIYSQYLKLVIYLKYALETPLSTNNEKKIKESKTQDLLKSSLHYNLVIFMISEDLIIERILFPYLNTHLLTFSQQPLLSRCIEFHKLISEFINYLDNNISLWNLKTIENIINRESYDEKQRKLLLEKREQHQQNKQNRMTGATDHNNELITSTEGLSHSAQLTQQLSRQQSITKTIRLRVHSSHHSSSSSSSATAAASTTSFLNDYYDNSLDEKEILRCSIIPWSIRIMKRSFASRRSSLDRDSSSGGNSDTIESTIPEDIQRFLIVQIGLKKISSFSYDKMSLINIKRIFIINWKIALSISKCYVTLIRCYSYYMNQLVSNMISNTSLGKTEKKFHFFLQSINDRIKDLGSGLQGEEGGVFIGPGKVFSEITFTLQSLADNFLPLSPLSPSERIEEERMKKVKETKEKQQKESLVDDLLSFLLSIMNDLIRLQSQFIPETLSSFLVEYSTLSNDLLLSKSSSSGRGSLSSQIPPPGSGGRHSFTSFSSEMNPSYYMRMINNRRRSSQPGNGKHVGTTTSATNSKGTTATAIDDERDEENIAMKQFRYLFLKPTQLIDSLVSEGINHICNQIIFYSEVKDYYLLQFEQFIMMKGLRKQSKRREEILAQLQHIPTLLMTPFFHLKTQLNINLGTNATASNDDLQQTDPSRSSDNQQDAMNHQPIITTGSTNSTITPMEVVMATLTEFYSFLGRHVKISVLYEIIYQFMIKLVKRYLILIRDILTRSKWKYQLKQRYSTINLITSAPGTVLSVPLGVAKDVLQTVPQLPSMIGRTLVSAAHQVQQILPGGAGGNNDETTTITMDEEYYRELADEEEEIENSGKTGKAEDIEEKRDSDLHSRSSADDDEIYYLKAEQLQQMKDDVNVIIRAHEQIKDEKIHSVLRFLNMAVVDVWSSSHSEESINRILIEQFKSQV
jgi:hypothetical protein